MEVPMIETPIDPSAPQRSPDGLWEWNGAEWIPARGAPNPEKVAQSTPFVPAASPVQTASPAQVRQISPDGKYSWSGAAWVPLKKQGHMVRNIGIVVGALLLVGIGGAIASSGNSNNSTSVATTSSSPAPTVAGSVAPKAAASVAPVVAPPAKASVAPAGPKVLLDKTGTGISKTAIFTTPSEWTIAYNFDCSNFGQAGNFMIVVYDGSSQLKDAPANALAMTGSDTVYEHNLSGPYYLEMNSECNWHVIVKG
jgi:hypothetical protein